MKIRMALIVVGMIAAAAAATTVVTMRSMRGKVVQDDAATAGPAY